MSFLSQKPYNETVWNCRNFTRKIKECEVGEPEKTCKFFKQKICKAIHLPGKCAHVTHKTKCVHKCAPEHPLYDPEVHKECSYKNGTIISEIFETTNKLDLRQSNDQRIGMYIIIFFLIFKWYKKLLRDKIWQVLLRDLFSFWFKVAVFRLWDFWPRLKSDQRSYTYTYYLVIFLHQVVPTSLDPIRIKSRFNQNKKTSVVLNPMKLTILTMKMTMQGMIIAANLFHWISPMKLRPNIPQEKDLTSWALQLSMVSKLGFHQMAKLQFGTSRKIFGVLEMLIICLHLFAG